jgi:hypothetical protein
MLEVEIRSNRSTRWEMIARATIVEAAKFSDSLESAERYFANTLREMRLDSVGHIADAYKARIIQGENKALIVQHFASKIRLIAIVKEVTNDKN